MFTKVSPLFDCTFCFKCSKFNHTLLKAGPPSKRFHSVLSFWEFFLKTADQLSCLVQNHFFSTVFVSFLADPLVCLSPQYLSKSPKITPNYLENTETAMPSIPLGNRQRSAKGSAVTSARHSRALHSDATEYGMQCEMHTFRWNEMCNAYIWMKCNLNY